MPTPPQATGVDGSLTGSGRDVLRVTHTGFVTTLELARLLIDHVRATVDSDRIDRRDKSCLPSTREERWGVRERQREGCDSHGLCPLQERRVQASQPLCLGGDTVTAHTQQVRD
jgi:hypothetical protein